MKSYTLIPRITGYIEDWITMIPHIHSLGFDTIHILPITMMGNSKSPYASTNPYQIDPCYNKKNSSEDALQQFSLFVKEIKSYNMTLCVDIVCNHLSVDSPILQDNKHWTIYDESEDDKIKRAGWSDGKNWYKWDDLALLNYEENIHGSLWSYMYNYIEFWVELIHDIKGILRLDNLHSSNESFTQYCLLQIQKQYPHIKLLSELFESEGNIKKLIKKYKINYLLATQWEHPFVHQLRPYIQYLHSPIFSTPHYVPVLTHDSGSIVDEFGKLDSTIPRAVVSGLMGTGHWGIVQGMEYGLEKKNLFIGEMETHMFLEKHKDDTLQYAYIFKQINKLISTHKSVFECKSNLEMISQYHNAVISAIRFSRRKKEHKDYFIILANMDTLNPQRIVLSSKECYELGFPLYINDLFLMNIFTNEVKTIEHKNNDYVLDLKEGECCVFYIENKK